MRGCQPCGVDSECGVKASEHKTSQQAHAALRSSKEWLGVPTQGARRHTVNARRGNRLGVHGPCTLPICFERHQVPTIISRACRGRPCDPGQCHHLSNSRLSLRSEQCCAAGRRATMGLTCVAATVRLTGAFGRVSIRRSRSLRVLAGVVAINGAVVKESMPRLVL